jgi:hypothetical protein
MMGIMQDITSRQPPPQQPQPIVVNVDARRPGKKILHRDPVTNQIIGAEDLPDEPEI